MVYNYSVTPWGVTPKYKVLGLDKPFSTTSQDRKSVVFLKIYLYLTIIWFLEPETAPKGFP